MGLAGKFTLESRENYEAFMKASGASDEQIARVKAASLTTELVEDGADSFTVKRIYPNQTVSNTFKLGVPQDFSFADGKTIKATVTLEGDSKLVLSSDKFSQISELEGDKLKETLKIGDVTMIRYSSRV